MTRDAESNMRDKSIMPIPWQIEGSLSWDPINGLMIGRYRALLMM